MTVLYCTMLLLLGELMSGNIPLAQQKFNQGSVYTRQRIHSYHALHMCPYYMHVCIIFRRVYNIPTTENIDVTQG